MKILFIYPSSLDVNNKPVKHKKSIMPQMVLPILDGMTPAHHSVQCLDDLVEEIDFTKPYDLVGISALTTQAPRAYQIADTFRARGVKVIIGGIHATALPDEAKLHADAVVVGEVDDIWEQILDDCENNNLKAIYKADSFPDITNAVLPRWDNMNMKNYYKIGKKPIMPLFTSRGCPMGCKFCSVTKFFGKTFRVKPVSTVIKEVDMLDADYYNFNDDNIAFNVDYSRELFKALIPKNIRWASNSGVKILKNPDLIELAGKSGCVELLLGLETLDTNTLESMDKEFNKIEEYKEVTKLMHKAGISVLASFIIGFDEDTPEKFNDIMDFCKTNNITRVLVNVLTPMPGTKLFEEIESQGRITDDDWSRYNGTELVFKAKNFSKQQMSNLFTDFYKKTYTYKKCLFYSWYTARHIRNQKPVREFFESLMIYYSYRKMVMRYAEKGEL